MGFAKILRKLLALFMVFVFFTLSTQAVNIVLNDNEVVKIVGDGDPTTCKTGDVFRIGTSAIYHSQQLDLLVQITDEDNEYDELTNSHGNCISVKNGILETHLRDRDSGDDIAYMDLNITVVARGTTTPVEVDRIVFAAFDLDKGNHTSGNLATGTDNVYIKSPSKAYIQSDGNSDVTYTEGDFSAGFDKELQGRDNGGSSDCADNPNSPEPACRGGGIAIEGPNGPNRISSLDIRVYNENAYGRAGSVSSAYRLIQLSFMEHDFEAILEDHDDHGDIPQSYGDARHKASVFTVLGYGYPADNEDAQYSTLADLDDKVINGEINFDDEDGVRIGSRLLGSEFNMTVGYEYDINVTTIGDGYLSIWVDLNGDGTFDNAGDEKLLEDEHISSTVAINTIKKLSLPTTNYSGRSYIRFRFSKNANVEPNGDGGKGEVEDYTLFLLPSGSVSGRVYDDRDGNHMQDPDEPGLPDVNVTVTAGNGEAQSVLTDANGDYTIEHVAAGQARVDIDESTLPDGSEISEGENPHNFQIVGDTDNDAGNVGYMLSADLQTSKTVDTHSPREGDTVAFTLTVTNHGPVTATNVSLTDQMPEGITLTGNTPSQGTYDDVSGKWTIGTLANGANATLILRGTVDQNTYGQTITNTTTAASTPDQTDNNSGGDDLNESITVGGLPTVTISSATVTEGETLVFNVTLSEASNYDTVVNIRAENDVATNPEDFNDANVTSVTIEAGSTVATTDIGVSTKPDNIDEPTETMKLKGTVTSGNTANTNPESVGTIEDNTDSPTVNITDATVTEGEVLRFEIKLDHLSTEDTIITFTTRNGTAENPADYNDTTTPTVTIAAYSDTAIAEVPTNDDPFDEGNNGETMILNGTITSGNTINHTVQAMGTILDNDEKPRLFITPKAGGAKVTEGTPLIFEFNLSSPSATDTYIIPSTEDGTATTPEDYRPATGYIKIPAHATSVTYSITTNDDAKDESDEEYMTMKGIVIIGEVTDTDAQARGIILDNDDPITVLNITDDTANEGQTLKHLVQLSATSDHNVSLEFKIENITTSLDDYGTPQFSNGVHYDSASETITVPRDVSMFGVLIPANEDEEYENDEYYRLVIDTKTGTGLIYNTTPKPGISAISDSNVTEGETLIHTVIISGHSQISEMYDFSITNDSTQSEDYNSTPGFEVAPGDENITYDEASGMITVPAGINEFNITIGSFADDAYEGSESYIINLGEADATGTINDTNLPRLTVDDANITEGGDLVFEIHLSDPSSEDTYITFTTQDISTSINKDYNITSPSWIKIPKEETEGSFTIHTNDDTHRELSTEKMKLLAHVFIGNVTNMEANSIGSILDNDNKPHVISISSDSNWEGSDLHHTVRFNAESALTETYTIQIENNTTLENDITGIEVSIPGDPDSDIHYDATNHTVTVPAFTPSFEITVHTQNDDSFDDNRFYTITIDNASGIGTIQEDENES